MGSTIDVRVPLIGSLLLTGGPFISGSDLSDRLDLDGDGLEGLFISSPSLTNGYENSAVTLWYRGTE